MMAWPNKITQTIECKQGAVRAVRFNVDGNYCLTCGSDKSVKLWSASRGVLLKTYYGHGFEVLDACSSGDNAYVCSGGMDKTVVMFDVAGGKILRKYRDHAGTVNCVCFNEDSSLILSGSIDCSVRIWDCRTRKNTPIQVMDEPKDSITSIQVSDHEILIGSADCRIRRYDLRIGRMFSDFVGKAVSCASFTRDGQCVLVSMMNNPILLLDKSTGEMLNEYKGHKNSSYRIESCLNHDDTHILSGSEDGKIFVWDLMEATVKEELQDETRRPIHSLSHHPSQPVLLSACGDKISRWESNQPTETADS